MVKMKAHSCPPVCQGHLVVGIASAIIILLATPGAWACTAFLQEGLFAGKNYDWHLDYGLLIVNKKGITKRAILLDPTDKAAEWVSRYGSVTFNQYGREMPNGGINEAGLVVETLMLPGTQNPVRMIGINTPHTGVLNPYFTDYDADQNRWLIYYCVRHTPLLSLLREQLLELLARYPETTQSK
jgi:hypothetical protein